MTGSRRDGFVLVRVVRPGGVPSTASCPPSPPPDDRRARDRADHSPGHDRDDQRGPSRREDPMDLDLLRIHHSKEGDKDDRNTPAIGRRARPPRVRAGRFAPALAPLRVVSEPVPANDLSLR